MNITEFAEQIVFGTTLEDKLAVPGKLSFGPYPNAPGVESLIVPGRPAVSYTHLTLPTIYSV